MSVGPRWVRVGSQGGARDEEREGPPAEGALGPEPSAALEETPSEDPIPWDLADGAGPDASDLETQLLTRWREERRRLTVVPAGGPPFAAQLLGAGRHVLYVADADGQARLLYRWAIRELIPLED